MVAEDSTNSFSSLVVTSKGLELAMANVMSAILNEGPRIVMLLNELSA
jgi:hypothetical protein